MGSFSKADKAGEAGNSMQPIPPRYGNRESTKPEAREAGDSKMPHTYTNLLFHIVFSTKDRFPFINSEFEERLYEYIGGTIRGIGGICLEIGGVADHVHILVRLKPTLQISRFLEKLKPSVPIWARQTIDPKFEWQDGYGAFTVGESQIPSVRNYIRNQKVHHQKQTFDDEFKSMLTQATIEFDERYLWR